MNIQKDPETVAQVCFNSQDISGLLRMEKVDILEQLSKEALLVLEKKSFAIEDSIFWKNRRGWGLNLIVQMRK